MSEVAALFAALRQSADPGFADALEQHVATASDRALNRINALDFAAGQGLDADLVIAGLLHAARLGIFELSWNVLCPGCGGVLDVTETMKTLRHEAYDCALCAAGYEATLDEGVEVTFTVSARVRRIAAHDPSSLPLVEYFRQVFWGTGIDLPEEDELGRLIEAITLDTVELPPGERAILSVQLPRGFIILFDPVTHGVQFLEVEGEPTRERQNLSMVFNKGGSPTGTLKLRPGPLRVTFENRNEVRVLPSLWIAGDQLHALLGRRKPFLTARRLLTNQTFRDLYRTDALDVDQRLKILSLTFLFTDLKGSTELYDRVGDLVAYDLVRSHFRVLNEIVAAQGGAVVKTIGDAVMATFEAPQQAVAAALRMRDAMRDLNQQHQREDLLLKIGIHKGPCLAVMLNERQDYFGQTVNIASRVQGLAAAQSILATVPVVEHPPAAALLEQHGLHPVARTYALRGVAGDMSVYEIA
jgi:class 3 adenylate cyclase